MNVALLHVSGSILALGAADVADLTRRARGFPGARRVIGCIADAATAASEDDDARLVVLRADPVSSAGKKQVLAISDSFDAIIDSGSAGQAAVIEAFAHYWPYLTSNATYVIDELHRFDPVCADEGVSPPTSVVAFVKRLWDVAHVNQRCGACGAASRAAVIAPFAAALGSEFREDELARVFRVELSGTRCVIHKAPATGAQCLPNPDPAGNESREQTAERQANSDAPRAALDRNREVFALEQEIRRLRALCDTLAGAESEFAALSESASWRWTRPLRVGLGLLLREPAYVDKLLPVMDRFRSHPLVRWLHPLLPPDWQIEQAGITSPRQRRDVSVDIVVLVNGQVALVRKCLESILRSTLPPYRLFLMDVSGQSEIHTYLEHFAVTHGARFLPHDPSVGVGRTLYSALRQPNGGGSVVLLRDDSVVSEGWLDGLMQAAASAVPWAAVVGPLTTAMLHGLLPATEQGAIVGDTTTEPADLDNVAAAAFRVGCRLPISVPRLDGSCFLFRLELLKGSGSFDEPMLASGIGLTASTWPRVRRQRLRLLLASDVYVETGAEPSRWGRQGERDSAGTEANSGIWHAARGSVTVEPDAPHLVPLAATCARVAEEVEWFRDASSRNPRLEGRRVALLMPDGPFSAGIAALLNQAQALREVGVDAWIVRVGLSQTLPEAVAARFQLPVLWARSALDVETTLAGTGIPFDAVVAVGMDMLEALPPTERTIFGCYLLAELGGESAVSEHEQRALLRRPGLGRLRLLAQDCRTAEVVSKQLALNPVVVGSSIDTAVFRPLPGMAVRKRALRVSVLLGPATGAAGLSLGVLPTHLRSRLGLPMRTQAVIAADLSLLLEGFAATESLADISPPELALRLRRTDVFLDLSDSPASELVTLAAMACGCAVVIACSGDGPEFACHEENALIVDCAVAEAPAAAVARLTADPVLRGQLRRRAAADATTRPHRRAALALAAALFGIEPEVTRD